MTFFGLSFSVFPLYFLWGGVGGGWEGLGAESNCEFKPNDRESGQAEETKNPEFFFFLCQLANQIFHKFPTNLRNES